MGSGIAKINRNIAENLNPDVRVFFLTSPRYELSLHLSRSSIGKRVHFFMGGIIIEVGMVLVVCGRGFSFLYRGKAGICIYIHHKVSFKIDIELHSI